MADEMSDDDRATTEKGEERERLVTAIEDRRKRFDELRAWRTKLEVVIDELRIEQSTTGAMGDNDALRAEVQRLKGEKEEIEQDHKKRRAELETLIATLSQECRDLERELRG